MIMVGVVLISISCIHNHKYRFISYLKLKMLSSIDPALTNIQYFTASFTINVVFCVPHR